MSLTDTKRHIRSGSWQTHNGRVFLSYMEKSGASLIPHAIPFDHMSEYIRAYAIKHLGQPATPTQSLIRGMELDGLL